MKTITNSKIGYNGRLGNQLFQFASLFGIAKKTGKRMVLPESNKLKRQERFSDAVNREVYFELPEIFPKVCQFFDKSNSSAFPMIVREAKFGYDESVNDLCSKDHHIDMDGYFQSSSYFDEYSEELKEILSFGDIERNETVSVHVRRGDYLSLPTYHRNLPLNYYVEAMNLFKGRRFTVFSDDIKWCRENFLDFDCDFSQGLSGAEDMKLMSSCADHIISNSTFSWWAAFLNTSKEKRVVCPEIWFGTALRHYDTSGLISIATDLL